jgi:hypothetical protein
MTLSGHSRSEKGRSEDPTGLLQVVEGTDLSPSPADCLSKETFEALDIDEIAAHSDVDADTVGNVLEALVTWECDRKPWKDPRVLARLYYDEGLTQGEIADELGCGQKTVSRRMKRYGLAPGRGNTAVAQGLRSEASTNDAD